MKLTAKIKLQPNNEQRQDLIATMHLANAACNYISDEAWKHKVFGKFKLQKIVYQAVRERFDLSAQVTIRCIAKVSDAYKLDRDTKRTFRPEGAIAYDNRILRYKLDRREVSIWTVDGRQTIPFVAGDRQVQLLARQKGESDLGYINGEFYLFAVCDADDPTPDDVEGYLGVDLGIVNIATDSDGEKHSGSQVLGLRKRRRRQRRRLQKKGTRSAKRRLKKLSGRERRFATDINHCLSKKIVQKAKDTGRGLALEDLTGIRDRARLRKPQRTELNSWAFYQLGQFIQYKAALAGVPVVFVDPAYTSQTCSCCGFVDKSNRKSQDKFLCGSCGFSANADRNAATNISIRGWGVVNRPNATDL